MLTLLLLGACNYGFVGGGLPQHIDSVAILPFENDTPQPLIGSDVQQALQLQLPRNLGVRLGSEATADAVVRGRILGYDEIATGVRPTGADRAPVSVVQRQVQVRYEAEIYDLREDKPIWRAQSQTVLGSFQPDRETAEVGRAKALQELVTKIIEGAQSQW